VRVVDGEVQVRGPGLMRGYRGDAGATAEAFTEDGWLRTGDTGSLDADGHLRVTGRARDAITTSDGRALAPTALEDLVRRSPLVSRCVVLGAGGRVAALLTVDEDALGRWAARRNRAVVDAATDEDLRAELGRVVEAANRSVSRAASITAFAVLARDLSEAAGELTAAGTVRRDVVLKTRAADIAALPAG
jgi:long-chain acyl-CoA synthetase